jgi:hypothetical protein
LKDFGQGVLVVGLLVFKPKIQNAMDVTVGGFARISWLKGSLVVDAKKSSKEQPVK